MIYTNKNLKFFLIFSWVLCLLSIGSAVENNFLVEFKYNKENVLLNINLLRFFSPTIIFPILLFFFLKLKKQYNHFICTYFIYGFWQILIFIILKDNLDIIQNYQIILNLFTTLLIFQLINHFNEDLKKNLLFIFMIFIFLILLFFSYKLFLEFYNNNDLYLYKSNILAPNNSILEQAVPRITGLSRMAIIIFSFIFLYQITTYNKIYKTLCKLFLFFLVIAIYAFNTRTGIVGLIIFFLYYFIFINHSITKKILNFFFIIILPILIFEMIINIKINLAIKKNNLEINYLSNNNRSSDHSNNISKHNRVLTYQGSSGRIEIWRNSLAIIQEKNIILGIGPQADRKLLTDYIKKNSDKIEILENNSSNAIIYSYLCGGLVSFFAFMFIYILVFKEIFLNLFLKKLSYKNNLYVNFSLFNLIFLSLRTFFENGYAHFGIDFCLLCLCYFIIKDFDNSKKTYN